MSTKLGAIQPLSPLVLRGSGIPYGLVTYLLPFAHQFWAKVTAGTYIPSMIGAHRCFDKRATLSHDADLMPWGAGHESPTTARGAGCASSFAEQAHLFSGEGSTYELKKRTIQQSKHHRNRRSVDG